MGGGDIEEIWWRLASRGWATCCHESSEQTKLQDRQCAGINMAQILEDLRVNNHMKEIGILFLTWKWLYGFPLNGLCGFWNFHVHAQIGKISREPFIFDHLNTYGNWFHIPRRKISISLQSHEVIVMLHILDLSIYLAYHYGNETVLMILHILILWYCNMGVVCTLNQEFERKLFMWMQLARFNGCSEVDLIWCVH